MKERFFTTVKNLLVVSMMLILSSNASIAASNTHGKGVHKKQSHHKVHTNKKHASHVKKASLAARHHHGKTKRLAHQKKFLPNVAKRNNVSSVDTQVSAQPGVNSRGFVSMTRRLVSYVYNTVSNLSYSAYKLGGKEFDTFRGVYVLDCSNYVDHILQKIYPHAYSSLVTNSGSDQPTSLQYYDFFNRLSQRPKHYWNPVTDVEELQPGDILVFRKKQNLGSGAAGHVMIVMNKPVRDMNSFLVRVADSAPVGHSQDTRMPHVSGIGIGNLLLKVNPKTGQPLAYAWKVGSRWKEEKDVKLQYHF